MLVLTRRPGESVLLTDSRTGEHIGQIRFINVTGEHGLRIGFDCPAHIAIVRDNAKKKELLE